MFPSSPRIDSYQTPKSHLLNVTGIFLQTMMALTRSETWFVTSRSKTELTFLISTTMTVFKSAGDTVTTSRSLNKLWILCYQDLVVLFCFPIPNTIRCEQQIHFLKCALIGFRIQSPDHGDCNDVAGCEDKQCVIS